MITIDAKPDPPRTEINDTYASNVNTATGYTPNNNNSFTHKRIFSPKNFKFFRLKPEGKVVNFDKQRDNTPKSDKGRSDTSINYNIINSNGIKIGATTTYICNISELPENFNTNHNKYHSNRVKSENTAKIVPAHIKRLSSLESELTFDDIYTIKTHTGNAWRKIFLSLGYSNGQLDQFMEDYKSKGIGEVIYQLITDWKCANGKQAYIGIIVKKLWEHGEHDCVERLYTQRSQEFKISS